MTTIQAGDRVRVKAHVAGTAGRTGFIHEIDEESETVFIDLDHTHFEMAYHPDQLERIDESNEVGGSRPGDPAVSDVVEGPPDHISRGSWANPLAPVAPATPPATAELPAPAVPSSDAFEDLIRRQLALGMTVAFDPGPNDQIVCIVESYDREEDDYFKGEGSSPGQAIWKALNPNPPVEPEGGFDDGPF